MIDRITPPTDVTALALFTTASIFNFFSESDWNRITGPFGGLVVSLAMLVLLVRHSAARIRKDDERHNESIAVQKLLIGKLDRQAEQHMELTKRCLESEKRTTVAIESVDSTLQLSASRMEDLTRELRSRTCFAKDHR